MEYRHAPVMLSEAIEHLKPGRGGVFVDCTLGGGGYTQALLDAVGESGRVISIDMDELAINNARDKFKNYKNLIIAHDNFKNLQAIIDKFLGKKNSVVDGIVFDLGLSSAQLEDGSRGLSFRVDAPLNMSFGDNHDGLSTFEIVNKTKEQELSRIIWEYGEERYANRIARRIVEAGRVRPLSTTAELVEAISSAIPASYRHNSKIHFATRTFQALRIATNREIDNLSKVLPQAINLLKPGGRLVVISYHSLEDRVVKNWLRQESKNCLCSPQAPICNCQHQANLKIITKKPLIPTASEVTKNSRARSAKMRVAEKIQTK